MKQMEYSQHSFNIPPQKLKLKSTVVKQDKIIAAKKPIRPNEIHDFFGRYSGYLMIKANQIMNSASIKILKEICFEVINGKSRFLKTKKTEINDK